MEENDEDDDTVKYKPIQGLCPQIFFSLNIGLGMFLVGFALAYTSPALPSMETSESTIRLTPYEESLVSGMLALGGLVGSVIGGRITNALGRRITTFSLGPPFAAGWLLIFFAVNLLMLCIGRALVGIVVGVSCVCMAVYLAEAVQPELRGILGLVPTTIGKGGILICYVIGKYLAWRKLALVGAIIVIPYMIIALMVPESPIWYFFKGKIEKGEKALRWLRGGKGAKIDEELHRHQLWIQHLKAKSVLEKGRGCTYIFQRRYSIPVAICIYLMVASQAVGFPAVIYYCARIFEETDSSLHENDCAIIIGGVNVLTAIIGNILIDKTGRRNLLIISSIGSCVSSGILGLYFFVQMELEFNKVAWEWIPLISTIVYIIFYQIGLGPIPWLVLGEILPGDIRGTGASIAMAISWLSAFLVTWLFPIVSVNWGLYTSFWCFAGVSLLTFVFVAFLVPETRGRTLEDIEREMEAYSPSGRTSSRHRKVGRRSFIQEVRRWSAQAPSAVTPTGSI